MEQFCRNLKGRPVQSVNEQETEQIFYNEEGHNAIHRYAKEGDETMVYILMHSFGVFPQVTVDLLDAPTRNDKEQTPLHLGVLSNSLKVVKHLIERGANVNSRDKALVSALSYAARAGREHIVHYLINNGADVNSVDQNRVTPVHHAVKCGQWNSVKCLVEYEADLNVADERGATPVGRVVKEGEWDMVRYLLENGASLVGLSDDAKGYVSRRLVNPSSDVEGQFYQAVKLGNVEILEMLIRNHVNQSDANIEELLAKTYDHLKLCNLRLNQRVCVYIENKLFNFRFNSKNEVKSKKNGKEKIDLNNVKDRIELVINCIDHLSVLVEDDEVSDTFLFIGKFIAQNLQVLKRQLPSTFDLLPWEEMQFCLLTFISRNSNPKYVEIIYDLIIYKQRLLSHLKVFGDKLKDSERLLNDEKLDNNKMIVRETAIKNILKVTPEFNKLYEDFEILKDVFLIRRINEHLEIACAIDLDKNPLIGQLAIERALQVTGECLKNTVESPNMSGSVQHMLLKNVSIDIGHIFTSLRISLSHVDTLTSRAEVDPNFHLSMQDGLRKVRWEIGMILLDKRSQAKKMFVERILECENVDQTRTIASGIQVGRELKLDRETRLHFNFIKISEFIEDLDDLIETKTEAQDQLFEDIRDAIHKRQIMKMFGKWERAQTFRDLDWLINLIRVNGNIDTIKNQCRRFLGLLNLPDENENIFQKILVFFVELQKSVPKKSYEMKRAFYGLLSCTELKGTRTSNFRLSFEKLIFKKEQDKIYANVLSIIDRKMLFLFRRILDAKTQNAFREEFEKKKRIYKAKNDLVEFYERKFSTEIRDESQFVELMKKINFQLNNDETYSSLYTEKDEEKCQQITQRIKRKIDSYETLIKIIYEPTNTSMQSAFKDFIKSFSASENQGQNIIDIYPNIFYDEDQYFQALQNIESILGTEKNDCELLNLLRANDDIRLAIEMLMLTLMETLDNCFLLETNSLFLDEPAPILIGKNLRNYLAHGDLLMDVLSIDHLKSIISHYRILKLNCDQRKSIVYTNNYLIGKETSEDISMLKANYQHKLELLEKQNDLFSAAKTFDAIAFKGMIDNYGLKMNCRRSNGWTLLHSAAQKDNLELFKFLLNNNLNIYQKDVYGNSIFYYLSQFNSKSILQFVLNTISIDLDADLGLNKTLLYLAAQFGCDEILNLLIENGAKVDAIDSEGNTPTHIACKNGHLHILLTLLKAGANLSVKNKTGSTLLHSAAFGGHVTILKFLIRKGLSVHVEDDDNRTPLHIACLYGHKTAVDILHENNVDVDVKTDEGESLSLFVTQEGHDPLTERLFTERTDTCDETALHRKVINVLKRAVCICSNREAKDVEEGHREVVKVLLKKGSTINGVTKNGETALHMAVVGNSEELVKILVEYKANVNNKNENGATALHLAAQTGSDEIARILIDSKCNINEGDSEGRTPLHFAVLYNKLSTLELLIDRGADINVQEEDGTSPLFIACELGYYDIFEMLISKGANVFTKSLNGWTPLYISVCDGHLKIVEKLILLDDGKDYERDLGKSLLHTAAERGQDSIIKLLLKMGEDVNRKLLKDGDTPLHFAARYGQDKAAVQLLLGGADVNATSDSDAITSLHLAAFFGHACAAEALLNFGAQVDARLRCSHTPLHLAAMNGHSQMISVLCKYKTNVNATTDTGSSSLHIAVQLGDFDVIETLIKHGADVFAENNHDSVLHQAVKNDEILKLIIAEIKSKSDRERLRSALNVEDGEGDTPLMWTAEIGLLSSARLLLECEEVDVNSQNLNDWTALHFAVQHSCFDVIEILIKNGADVFAKNNHDSVLHKAVRNDKILKLIIAEIKSKSDGERLREVMNAGDTEGDTPLMWTAENGYLSSAQLLLECEEVDINKQNLDGKTALHWAALNGHGDVFELLMANKANANIKDANGATASDLAEKSQS